MIFLRRWFGSRSSVPPQITAYLQQIQSGQLRNLQQGDQFGLDETTAAWECILTHPRFGSMPEEFQLMALNEGAIAFICRYQARDEINDLDRAEVMWQTIVSRTPPDSLDLLGYLNNLRNGLRARYARTKQLTDLKEAILSYKIVISCTPPDLPYLPFRLNNLGHFFRDHDAHGYFWAANAFYGN